MTNDAPPKAKLIAHVKNAKATQKLKDEEAARLKEIRRTEVISTKRAREESALPAAGGKAAPCRKVCRTTGQPGGTITGKPRDAISSPGSIPSSIAAAGRLDDGKEEDELQIVSDEEAEEGCPGPSTSNATCSSLLSKGSLEIPRPSFAPPPEDDDLDIIDESAQWPAGQQAPLTEPLLSLSGPPSKPAPMSAMAVISLPSKGHISASGPPKAMSAPSNPPPPPRTALGPSQAVNLPVAREMMNPAALWKTLPGCREDAAAATEAKEKEAVRRRHMAKLNPGARKQQPGVLPNSSMPLPGGAAAGSCGMAGQARPMSAAGSTNRSLAASVGVGRGSATRSAFEAAFGSLAKTIPEADCGSR